ncbi:Hypothetical predicted protein [Cloeon dipterum]|uniref:Uncharacterized protein n=1 Tax=Cloeon dipterum TaxID=197152 RepID=A0A8S1BR42_9INSE|nr:Hypothetical predicted protein [Cloeon dipterum]
MAEVDKLHLTKKRLQNLRRRSLGLQQLAVRVISKQLTFYTSQPDEFEKLKSLPGVLRDKILQVLMKKKCLDMQGREREFENLKVVFPMLLSPRTHYIELNSILSFCPDWFTDSNVDKVTPWCVELLKHIETRAPRVETLIIKRNNSSLYKEGPYRVQHVEFSQDMMQSLMKMGKLNRLTVCSYYFDFADLLKICKNLPKLQYINVELLYNRGNVSQATEDVSSSFCNLKELIFQCPPCLNNDYLSFLCTRNLPNIEVVGYDPNQNVDFFGIRRDANRYHSLDFPGTSNLRNICLFTESAEEAESLPKLFPKLTCLMVNNIPYYGRGTISLEEHVMPKFDNIRQFHLLYPYSGVFEKYLTIYGQKLQSLYLGAHYFQDITIDFKLILKYCPKLEKLSMINLFLKTPLPKIEFFAELKELEWKNNE